MNEDIKESIKHIQDIVDFYKLNDENNYDYSDKDLISMKTLLDYITNLQEENQKLVNVIKPIRFVFDNPENYFSDGCDCRLIEDILNKLTELKGGETK